MGRGKTWYYTEEKILIENYENMTIKELQELLPNRSKESINNKIKRLKRSKRISSQKDKNAIKRAYHQR